MPFSNNGAGAVTTSTISLSLLHEQLIEVHESSPYDKEELVQKREKLLFNHYPTPKHTTGEIKNARRLLQQMCELGFPDIKRHFIDVYSKFLQNARLLSTKALHQLFSRASSICYNNDNGKYVDVNIESNYMFICFIKICSIEITFWKVCPTSVARHPLK